MTQFLGCGNKGLEPLEIFLALIDDVDTLTVTRAFTGIRTIQKTIATRDPLPTMTCASKEEVFSLFQQALGIADDGRMALNVVIGDKANGIGLNSMQCGVDETIWGRLSRLFVNTSDGEVAVYINNIT